MEVARLVGTKFAVNQRLTCACPSKRTGLCASDPDGGWYVREGDHREREDDKGKPLGKIAWALEASIATMARPPGAPPAHPNLAAGLALTRPGEDPGGTGARVLTSMAARGHRPGPWATTAPAPRPCLGGSISRAGRIGHNGTRSGPALRKPHDTPSRPAALHVIPATPP